MSINVDDFVTIAAHTAEISVTNVKDPFISSESRSESGKDQRNIWLSLPHFRCQ